jgi:hypothetical protein
MKKHEKRVANELGGIRTRASGSVFTEKGDVIVRKLKLIVQCKETQQGRFQITNKILDKCLLDALKHGPSFYGALFITFTSAGRIVQDQVVVPETFLDTCDRSVQDSIKNCAKELNSMVISPTKEVYKFKDGKGRIWYCVPYKLYGGFER